MEWNKWEKSEVKLIDVILHVWNELNVIVGKNNGGLDG